MDTIGERFDDVLHGNRELLLASGAFLNNDRGQFTFDRVNEDIQGMPRKTRPYISLEPLKVYPLLTSLPMDSMVLKIYFSFHQ